MRELYRRDKRAHDRTLRCYLSLDCPANCSFCSAGMPSLDPERRAATLPARIWAEGINRRRRHTIFCGGEPLLYPELTQLLGWLPRGQKVEMYSNLMPAIEPFLEADRPCGWLISLHPAVASAERDAWYRKVERLIDAGNGVRFHVIKKGDWCRRRDFLLERGQKVTCCDDQGGYVKSTAAPEPVVTCATFIECYGPDGYRYPCVTLLGKGERPQEHISSADGPDGFITQCSHFGRCCPCDNLVEGRVTAPDVRPEPEPEPQPEPTEEAADADEAGL